MRKNKLHTRQWIVRAIRIIVGVLAYVHMGILSSCTRADIHYPEVVSEKGYVQIYPDMSEHTLPAVEYHFYNTDGKTEYLCLSCDGKGNFNGTLPTGTYRVIATNTAASNVKFSAMDSHETAIVRAASLNNRQAISRADYSMLSQPDNVYSTVLDELVVVADKSVRMEPLPTLLTKHLNLIFTMQGNLETDVVAMTGVLPGIYPAMHLYTCEGREIDQSPDMAINFETEQTGNQRKAQISLFGLCDPEYGDNYTNKLELELTMQDGTTANTTLNLTDIISDVIKQNQGDIPLDLTIPIEVKETEIGIVGEVGDWIAEGESEIEPEI